MKRWWRRWTFEVPLAIGDGLWQVLVVQLAAFLERLTVRKVIAFIPVAIIVIAYYHRIPIPPELMLVGDFLAYIDVFSVLILLGMMSRVTTILFMIKQTAGRVATLVSNIAADFRRVDLRHRRQSGAATPPRRNSALKQEDQDPGGLWHEVAVA